MNSLGQSFQLCLSIRITWGASAKYQYVGSTPDPVKSGPIQGIHDLWPIVFHTYGEGTSLWVLLSFFPLLNLNVSCDFLFQCDHLCWVYEIGNLAFWLTSVQMDRITSE